MSSGSSKRHRSELTLPPGQFARLVRTLRRSDVLTRIGLCILAALLMWLCTMGWRPPFAYREGDVPARDIVARVQFSQDDEEATEELKERRAVEFISIYINNPQELISLRQGLKDQVSQIIRSESFEKLEATVWQKFLTDDQLEEASQQEMMFLRFREAFATDPELERFEEILKRAFDDFESHGLLKDTNRGFLKETKTAGNPTLIRVHPVGNPERLEEVEVKDVRISEAIESLRVKLSQEFTSAMVSNQDAETATEHVLSWLNTSPLPVTLEYDKEESDDAWELEKNSVEMVIKTISPGEKLADARQSLDKDDIELLTAEYNELTANMTAGEYLTHFLADFGMYIALYSLCGFFVFYREPELLANTRRLATLLVIVALTVALTSVIFFRGWQMELVPLVLFSMILTIVYRREMALLLTSSVVLLITLSLGQGIVQLVIAIATVSTVIQLLDRIRSRTKLIYVGLGAGVVAMLTTIGVNIVASQAFGAEFLPADATRTIWESPEWGLVRSALWTGSCAFLAGVLMTGLLPFIERMFDVQTDISLLELGDQSHPLLQELVRRAPGTHNHSINVASIGEAAADAIGANGLLVRVGAYFHDIGKMLKPAYFIENQDQGVNRHDSLVPAMSTLVIIAHVKDGADLARQHNLPQSIINFIEQHHGTTLVEFFYRQAEKQNEEDPNGGAVEEASFRYPGPKPQTKEAGVMMLADACESASRTLVEPTPARIENLVHEIAMKRLLDDQFDECGLTLKELAAVEESLVKSLTAVYHGRVSYPDKQHSA